MVQVLLHWERSDLDAKNKSYSEGNLWSNCCWLSCYWLWRQSWVWQTVSCHTRCCTLPGPIYSRFLPYLTVWEEKKMVQSPFLCLLLAALGLSFGSLQLLCAVPESWNSHKHHLTSWLSRFTAAFHHQNFAKQPLGLGHYFKVLYQDKALSCTKTAFGTSQHPKEGHGSGKGGTITRKALICK